MPAPDTARPPNAGSAVRSRTSAHPPFTMSTAMNEAVLEVAVGSRGMPTDPGTRFSARREILAMLTRKVAFPQREKFSN